MSHLLFTYNNLLIKKRNSNWQLVTSVTTYIVSYMYGLESSGGIKWGKIHLWTQNYIVWV